MTLLLPINRSFSKSLILKLGLSPIKLCKVRRRPKNSFQGIFSVTDITFFVSPELRLLSFETKVTFGRQNIGNGMSEKSAVPSWNSDIKTSRTRSFSNTSDLDVDGEMQNISARLSLSLPSSSTIPVKSHESKLFFIPVRGTTAKVPR